MANQFEMLCPQCGRDDALDIQASVWVRVTQDGTDASEANDGSHEWGEESSCHCAACGWIGTVKASELAQELRDAFAGSFLQPCVKLDNYFEIETTQGIEIVPADVVGACVTDPRRDPMSTYLEGEPLEDVPARIEAKRGYMARLSAPGYMDCTSWTAHDSQAQAMQYLITTYAGD